MPKTDPVVIIQDLPEGWELSDREFAALEKSFTEQFSEIVARRVLEQGTKIPPPYINKRPRPGKSAVNEVRASKGKASGRPTPTGARKGAETGASTSAGRITRRNPKK